MFKWVSWVIRMGATALLLSFLCIWTTGYIVNSYMESVIKQLELPIDIQPIALSGVWGTLWGTDKKPRAEAIASNKPVDDSTANGEDTSDSPRQSQLNEDNEVSGEDSAQGNQGSTPEDDTAAELNGEASPSPAPEPNAAGEGEEDTTPAFNEDAAMGEQLSDEDRQALYAMVVSKLSPVQLSQLSDSLKGGLTSEELTQLQTMLRSTLTDQEYAQMMELLQGSKKPDTEAVAE